RSSGRSIYVLDEPTTGLHFEDVRKLLLVLDGLVEKGNTVVVIEHNLDVIKSADWIIDMGPEGGAGGGQVIATGTPEQVAGAEVDHTGRFLRELLPPASVEAAVAAGRAKTPRKKPARATGSTTKTAAAGAKARTARSAR